MERTLTAAREQFVRAVFRDTQPIEQPRLVAIIDSMIAWSEKHPDQLRFRSSDGAPGTIAFERVDSKVIVWTATTSRKDIPRLELLPKAANALSPEARTEITNTLNANMRQPILPTDKLRIGFGALKNAAALAAVQQAVGKLMKTM